MSSGYRVRPSSASASRSRPLSASSSLNATKSSPYRNTLTKTRPLYSTFSSSSSSSSLLSRSSSLLPPPRHRDASQILADAERQAVAKQVRKPRDISEKEKHSIIESLAQEQNGFLLMLLEKEQLAESERTSLLSSVHDLGDQRRLEKIFGIERAKAAKVIKQVTKQHEKNLALKMKELGMIDDFEEGDEFF